MRALTPCWPALVVITLLLVGCGGSDGASEEACEPGTLQCPCAEGGECLGEMICTEDGVCLPDNSNGVTSNGTTGTSNGTTGTSNGTTGGAFEGVGLSVTSEEARACELILRDEDGVLADVTFADSVMGRVVRQPPKASVAFLRRGDDGFSDGAVELQVRGDAASIQITLQRCFDRDGRELDGEHVVILR